MTNNKVPELRFPDFIQEWETKRLSDITKINQGLQIAITDRYTKEVENSFFYITNEFLKANSQTKYYIKNPPSSVLCEENDILMTRTGNTGKVVTGVRGAFHNNFFKIKYSPNVDKWFLYYFLTSHHTQHLILTLAGTSTIPDLNHSDFYRIKIDLPSFPEQQKIASLLMAVDAKIKLLTKKKALLEQYKKGVMQQLFSQQIRFKDGEGNDFPEWEEKPLRQIIVELNSGVSVNSFDEPVKFNHELGILKTSCITGGGFYPSLNKKIVTEEISRVVLSVTKDSILISRMNTPQLVGESGYVDKDYPNLFVPDRIWVAKIGKNNHTKFVSFLLTSKEMMVKISNIATGTSGSMKNIAQPNFLNLRANFPTLPEQEKIASFLTAIDSKISIVNELIEGTKAYKKGLLQQLFV